MKAIFALPLFGDSDYSLLKYTPVLMMKAASILNPYAKLGNGDTFSSKRARARRAILSKWVATLSSVALW